MSDGHIQAGSSSPIRRRPRPWLIGIAAVAGLAAGLLLLAWVLTERSWSLTEPLGDPEFGINYSCNHAEYLLLEDPGGEPLDDGRSDRAAWCTGTFARLHDELGFRFVRLSVEWSEVEPSEGQFDFTVIDALLAEAEDRDVGVLLTVGMKAQRHPEYYLPGWIADRVDLPPHEVVSQEPQVRDAALRMARAVVEHTAASSAIDAWGAENEPYVPSSRAQGWELDRDYVQALIAVIREADPLGRPVVINHGQRSAFDGFESERRAAIEDADVLAVSLYPFRNFSVLWFDTVVSIVELGPLSPNFAAQAREAQAAGDEYWITELQAEPWVIGDPRLLSPERPSANLDLGKLRRNIEYGRRTGAERVYLWGAEWWLMQAERHGDRSWLDEGRAIIAHSIGHDD